MIKRYFFLLIALCAQLFLSAQEPSQKYEEKYKERITQKKLNGVYIPQNLDDALKELDRLISAESKAKFKSMEEAETTKKLHWSLGQWMILNWQFYEGSRFSHYLQSAGVSHPDDMADFMILAYHRHLNGKDINIRELATRMKERRQKIVDERKKEGKVIEEKRVKKQ